jgi:plastocyanin
VTCRRPATLLVALAALLGSLLLAAPAQAAEQVVTITAEGVTPKVLRIAAGDTITFVNEDSSLGYRAKATSDNWDLDSGPVGLLPGSSYTHPEPITQAGTYTYRVADGEPHAGSVVLPAANGATPAPPPAGSSPAPSPGSSSSPAAASPSPDASPEGGTGTAEAPVSGGFGAIDTDPPPAVEGLAPPPAIALPDLPDEQAVGPLPETAPELEPEARPSVAAALPGRLSSPPTARGYGLPAALAAVLAAGVASLLVRLLLAEPAARRRARPSVVGPAPIATVH